MLLVPDLVLVPQKSQHHVLLGQVLDLEIKSRDFVGQVEGSGLEKPELGLNGVDVLELEGAVDGFQDVPQLVSVLFEGRLLERVLPPEVRVDEDDRKRFADVEVLPDELVRLLRPDGLVLLRNNLAAHPDVERRVAPVSCLKLGHAMVHKLPKPFT